MKKARLIALVFFATIVFFALCGTAWAGYTTTQLTNNYYNNSNPQINNFGQVVWEGSDGSGMEVFLYTPGSGTVQLTDDNASGTGHDFLQINNKGQVVWRWEWGIYLYTPGIGTVQLDGYPSYEPQINDSGQVVWMHEANGYNYDIFLYSPGSGTVRLTENYINDLNPRINSAGQVTWIAPDDYDITGYKIFRYSPGSGTVEIFHSYVGFIYGEYIQLSDSGQVVWEADGAEATDGASFADIYLYTPDLGTVQLTDDSFSEQGVQINSSGQVVWSVNDGSEIYDSVFLYTLGSGKVKLPGSGSRPQINDAGQVVWEGIVGGSSWQIFLYRRGTITQVSHGWMPEYPQINDSGQVVWEDSPGDSPPTEIFLATPCNGARPLLALNRTDVFWASYADYAARELSVALTVANSSAGYAYQVQITGSTNTNDVNLSTAVPASIGDIAGGASGSITLRYHVPTGVGSFKTSIYVIAQDSCGDIYSYPGPYPGS